MSGVNAFPHLTHARDIRVWSIIVDLMKIKVLMTYVLKSTSIHIMHQLHNEIIVKFFSGYVYY